MYRLIAKGNECVREQISCINSRVAFLLFDRGKVVGSLKKNVKLLWKAQIT